jgi:hypothetical protein
MPQQRYSNNMDDDYPYSTAIGDDNEVDLNSDRKASGTNPNYSNFSPNFYNPFEIKHRRRTSRGQFKILEKAFIENPKPNGKIRQGLAESLSMSPRGVQVWFQNRRAKAKQQQQQQQQKKKQQRKNQQDQQDNIVEDLEVSMNSGYAPVILSASNMVHSRSQSSSSSAYTCSDSLPLSYSSCSFTMDENKVQDLHVNHQLPVNTCSQPNQPWYSDASTVTGADEDDNRMIASSPFTPQVQSQVHVNSPDQNLWMMDGTSLVCHQTMFNEHQSNADASVIGDNAAIMPKTDLFTTIIQDNGVGGGTLNTWAYNDQFVPMSQATILQSVIGHANHHTTRLIGNNRNVDDWISSTQDHNLYLNQIMDHHHDNAMRRRSYPLEQGQAYWAGHQVKIYNVFNSFKQTN